jgi:hypothetical protein
MELGDLCRAIDGKITKCAHFPNEQVFPPPPCTCTSTPVPAAAPLPAPTHTFLLQAFLYLYQVCEALAYTHSMGIIHRCSAPLPALHGVTGRPLPLDTDYQAAVEGVDASEWLLWVSRV